jgi:hypothetical protein
LVAEHLLDLLGADRQVLASADPRLDEVAETSAFELLHQSAKPLTGAVIRDKRIGETAKDLRFISAAKDGAEERIE